MAVHRGHRQRLVRRAGRGRQEPRARSRPTWPSFDVWDRYDADNDGNFDEPDGYIDHFQAVHAGEGEDAGGGAAGRGRHLVAPLVRELDRLRHHGSRRRRSSAARRSATPAIWIGDYTVEAENGGLGVFAHEFAPRPRSARLLRHQRRRELDGVLDRSCRAARGSTTARSTSARPRTTWVRGRSSSSAGSTTPSCRPVRAASYTLSPAALQVDGQDQAVVVDVADEPRHDGLHRTPAGGARLVDVECGRPQHDAHPHARPDGHLEGDGHGERAGTTSRRASTTCTPSTSRPAPTEWTTLDDHQRLVERQVVEPAVHASPAASTVDFRFRYQSDGGVHLAGAFIDDIVVK